MSKIMPLTLEDQDIIQKRCTKTIYIYKLAGIVSILALCFIYSYMIYIGLIPGIGVLPSILLVSVPTLVMIAQNWFLRVKASAPFYQMLQAEQKEVLEGKIISKRINKNQPLLIEVGEERALNIHSNLWAKDIPDIKTGDHVRVHRVVGVKTKIFMPGFNVFRIERI